MVHFRNKNDLLAWLENHCPRKAIQNALIGGKIELLGIFANMPRSFMSGWIVKITSKRKTTWNIGIVYSVEWNKYFTFTIKSIPWKNWIGDKIEHPLFTGDNPKKYKELRNETGTN